MGMFTELVLSTNIKDNLSAVKILQYMCDNNSVDFLGPLPTHPLFSDETRWRYMFQTNSYYHVPRSHASIEYDDIGEYWTLIVRCDFKNYEDEIDLFVDWIAPYIGGHEDGKHMIGYSRYEDAVEPNILYVIASSEINEDENMTRR
jgi:hypothetical protein